MIEYDIKHNMIHITQGDLLSLTLQHSNIKQKMEILVPDIFSSESSMPQCRKTQETVKEIELTKDL